MPRKMDARVIRKRERLWTLPDLAEYLGCSQNDILDLEAMPVPDLLTRYLNSVEYRLTWCPVRKEKEGVDNFQDDPQQVGG